MTLSPDMESQLRELSGRIRALDVESVELKEQADERTAKFKESGVNPLTDESAFRSIDALYSASDEKHDVAKRLRAERDALMDRMSSDRRGGSGPGGDGASPIAFNFSRDDLAQLHRAIVTERGPATIQAAIPSSAFPPAGISHFDVDIVMFGRELTRIAMLLPIREITNAAATFYQGTVAAAAGTVAPGGTKPESSPVWTSTQVDARKVATWAKVEDEVMKDFDDAVDVIGTELIGAVIQEENNQLLNGNGTAPNMRGMLNTSGIGAIVRGIEPRVEALLKAITKVRVDAFSEPTGLVLHPDDFFDARIEKTADGEYLIGPPTGDTPNALWSIPTVLTTQIPVGTALVGNFAMACRLYVREGPSIEVNRAPGNPEWSTNHTLMRCEERMTVGVIKPKALVAVTNL